MAHAQKPDFIFRRNGRVHLNRQGRQFSRLLAAEVCASAAVMLDTPSSKVVWRVLTTYSIRQFPLHFPFRASPCAITFQLDSTVFVYLYIFQPTSAIFRGNVTCTGEVQQLYIINHSTTTTDMWPVVSLYMCNDNAALKVHRECYTMYTYSMYQNDG
jgi:hypothetical protein